MSVIQKSSALNMMGKVAIVTSAATPLGAQTCRTFLRHNCLVIGIDDEPIPESERLFSSQGTHFQTLQLSLKDERAVEKMVEHVGERFWKQGFDILITFGEQDGLTSFQDSVRHVIAESDGGTILKVLDEGCVVPPRDGNGEPRSDQIKAKVRTNVVCLSEFNKDDKEHAIQVPDDAIDEVKECVKYFRSSTREDVNTDKGNKGISHLLLYLASRLGAQFDGATVTADGTVM